VESNNETLKSRLMFFSVSGTSTLLFLCSLDIKLLILCHVDLCEELDKQVMEYEAMNERLEERVAKVEAENRKLGKL
jgi:hypothetical protein